MKEKLKGAGVVVLYFGVIAGIPLALEKVFVNEPTAQVQGAAETTETDEEETPETFHGYECTSDCSGHQAGYDWAEEKDLCEPEFDGGNSESFAEGVRAYAYDTCYYSDGDGPI